MDPGIPMARLVRPPGMVVREVFCFTGDVFFLFFTSPRFLQGLLADRRETSPHDRKLSEFYNPSPKIRGTLPQKNLGAKTCKILVDFIQPPTLIANISGTAKDI